MNSNSSYYEADMKGYGLFRRLFQFKAIDDEAEQYQGEKENLMLLKDIRQARQEWMNAASNFEQADDPDLIDYYIYKMKACQVMYNYLLRKAKESGLKQDIHCG